MYSPQRSAAWDCGVSGGRLYYSRFRCGCKGHPCAGSVSCRSRALAAASAAARSPGVDSRRGQRQLSTKASGRPCGGASRRGPAGDRAGGVGGGCLLLSETGSRPEGAGNRRRSRRTHAPAGSPPPRGTAANVPAELRPALLCLPHWLPLARGPRVYPRRGQRQLSTSGGSGRQRRGGPRTIEKAPASRLPSTHKNATTQPLAPRAGTASWWTPPASRLPDSDQPADGRAAARLTLSRVSGTRSRIGKSPPCDGPPGLSLASGATSPAPPPASASKAARLRQAPKRRGLAVYPVPHGRGGHHSGAASLYDIRQKRSGSVRPRCTTSRPPRTGCGDAAAQGRAAPMRGLALSRTRFVYFR